MGFLFLVRMDTGTCPHSTALTRVIAVPRVLVDGRMVNVDAVARPPVDLLALAQDRKWQSIDTIDPSEFGAERASATVGGAGAAHAAGAKAGGLSEPEFTRELLAFFEKLGTRDFGVERYSLSSPDIYRFFSRDGELHGLIRSARRH